MMNIDIHGFGHIQVEHMVMNSNGTLAVDGRLASGVADRLNALSCQLNLHVVTADTSGQVLLVVAGLPCDVHILPFERQAEGKRDYIISLGLERAVTIGNGRNDYWMLKTSALGIGGVGAEGAFSQTLAAADAMCTSIRDVLDLLCRPLRLTATLRA